MPISTLYSVFSFSICSANGGKKVAKTVHETWSTECRLRELHEVVKNVNTTRRQKRDNEQEKKSSQIIIIRKWWITKIALHKTSDSASISGNESALLVLTNEDTNDNRNKFMAQLQQKKCVKETIQFSVVCLSVFACIGEPSHALCNAISSRPSISNVIFPPAMCKDTSIKVLLSVTQQKHHYWREVRTMEKKHFKLRKNWNKIKKRKSLDKETMFENLLMFLTKVNIIRRYVYKGHLKCTTIIKTRISTFPNRNCF